MSTSTTKLRYEMKRESPLDLSVKTVCRSADSTDDRLHPFGHDIPKVNFKPDFNACRGPSTSLSGSVAQPTGVVGSQQPNITYHQVNPQQLALPPPPPLPTVVSSQQQQHLQVAVPTPLPPVVHNKQPLHLTTADEAWRAAIDRQIEQKFNSYTSSKKQHYHPHFPPPQQQQQQQQQQPQLSPHGHQSQQQQSSPPQQQELSPVSQQHQGPAQADKRVLEMLKQNIEARDQSGRPHIAEAPSTPAMVFSTPIRKEPSTTPLKKTDYYMAERTALTPFPKKIDYYSDKPYCNAPRIRTKAERKQVYNIIIIYYMYYI